MRAVAHSAALPDQARYAAAEAAFAEAKAYLSSREAQQMRESDLERVLHRLGQELMHKLLQGHRDQRSSGEAAGPVEGADDVERSQRRVHERHLETTVGTVQVARRGGSRSSTAPRRSSTSRAPPPTAPTSRWYSTSSTWPSTSGRRRMCSIARGALELALGLDGLQRILEGKASKVAAAMRRCGDRRRLVERHPQAGRYVRRLPAAIRTVSALRPPPRGGLSHRHRRRRGVPVPGPRPDGVDRRTLAPGRRRGGPEAAGATSQPRLRCVLGLPRSARVPAEPRPAIR